MSLTLIMPCAGKSTRFNSDKPKWMLTHPNGNLMLVESINGLDLSGVSDIIITVLKEHIENTKINLDKLSNKIFELKGIRPEFLILDSFTSSQSETVYETIQRFDIEGPIFIKDCDNYFNMALSENNLVCISILDDGINASNKSYVSLDKFGKLVGIVEKTVIGNKFCVGGYSFKSGKEFSNNFEKIKSIKGITREIYISHVIQQMLVDGADFEVSEVTSYCDWGTIKNWIEYTKEFKTLLIDIDGVLVKNSSEYFQPVWGESEALKENVATVNEQYNSGKVTIIITTSRKEEYKSVTIKQLEEIGVHYHRIIFGLPHAQRILINDFSSNNPYPSAISINLERDKDDLYHYLK